MTDTYRIFLTDYAPNRKIIAIKVIRTVIKLGLKEVKMMVDPVDNGVDSLIHETRNKAESDAILKRLVLADIEGDCTFSQYEPDLTPTQYEYALAIYIARELPIQPKDIREIAKRLEQMTEQTDVDPVSALYSVANMIETA
jgi:hypothetical protein